MSEKAPFVISRWTHPSWYQKPGVGPGGRGVLPSSLSLNGVRAGRERPRVASGRDVPLVAKAVDDMSCVPRTTGMEGCLVPQKDTRLSSLVVDIGI